MSRHKQGRIGCSAVTSYGACISKRLSEFLRIHLILALFQVYVSQHHVKIQLVNEIKCLALAPSSLSAGAEHQKLAQARDVPRAKTTA